MTQRLRRLSVLSVSLASIWALSLPATASSPVPPVDLQDQYKPIIVDGENLTQGLRKPIEKLSLQAVVNGQLEPIPYQIDEYNTGGALYFPDVEVPIEGTRGVFDPNDKLLFLYKDVGPRRDPSLRTDGKILSELELTDEKGIRRFAYLVEGSRLRSEAQYVRFSSELAQVETDFYSLMYDRKNPVNWQDFSYEGYTGEPPLDSMKIRMTGGVVTSLSKIDLNNDNFVARIAGENVGPIRTTSQMMITLWLLKLPLLDVSYQVHHYPKSMVYDVRVVIPEVRRKALVNPNVEIALDANALFGGIVRTALSPNQSLAIDGGMSPEEKDQQDAPLSLDNNWVWLSTQRKFDIIAFFDYVAASAKEPLSFAYHDDANRNDPPERFRGSVPAAGYRIKSFPMDGLFGFTVSMYLNEGFKGEPAVFSQTIRTQPALRVLPTVD